MSLTHLAVPRGPRAVIRSLKTGETRDGKKPLNLDDMFARIRSAIKPFRKAAMFELAELGYDSVFQILVGCIISIRTRDEVSLPTSVKLFERASTPREIAKLSAQQIDQL